MAIVRSSNGDIVIDGEGDVIEIDLFVGGSLPDIRRFDLVRYQNEVDSTEQEEYDILELGYWYVPSTLKPREDTLHYVEPDEDFIKRERFNH